MVKRIDIFVEDGDDKTYKTLSKDFEKHQISIFFLSMRVGVFYNIRKKLEKPTHVIGNTGEWDWGDGEIEEISSATFLEPEDVVKDIISLKKAIRTCEEFANAGIKKLRDLFFTEGKDKSYLKNIEILVEDLEKLVK